MSNLHAPTVPSGPTSAPTANGSDQHLSFAELQRKKDNMEAELKEEATDLCVAAAEKYKDNLEKATQVQDSEWAPCVVSQAP